MLSFFYSLGLHCCIRRPQGLCSQAVRLQPADFELVLEVNGVVLTCPPAGQPTIRTWQEAAAAFAEADARSDQSPGRKGAAGTSPGSSCHLPVIRHCSLAAVRASKYRYSNRGAVGTTRIVAQWGWLPGGRWHSGAPTRTAAGRRKEACISVRRSYAAPSAKAGPGIDHLRPRALPPPAGPLTVLTLTGSCLSDPDVTLCARMAGQGLDLAAAKLPPAPPAPTTPSQPCPEPKTEGAEASCNTHAVHGGVGASSRLCVHVQPVRSAGLLFLEARRGRLLGPWWPVLVVPEGEVAAELNAMAAAEVEAAGGEWPTW